MPESLIKNLEDIDRLINSFDLTKRQINKAFKSALRITMRGLKDKSAGDIARNLRVPKSLIKNRMVQKSGDTNKKGTGYFWGYLTMMTYQIPAVITGKPSIGKRGVKVGSRFFPYSFLRLVNRSPKKRWMILRRKKQGNGLLEDRVRVKDAVEAGFREYEKKVFNKFVRQLKREIELRAGLLD